MDDTFLHKCKEEGSDMSYAFAKRYYNVIFEAYLRHASHCVLGIINIGLIESSNNQVVKAANFLLKSGLVAALMVALINYHPVCNGHRSVQSENKI